ncbi:hypothetical protein PAXRUDRAFT_159995, partial [Paxillus rubicundulus Ve08.2h10]
HKHCDIQCTIVAPIAGAIPDGFLCAMHALVNFTYQAQSPIHMDSSIQVMGKALQDFHANKNAIINTELKVESRMTSISQRSNSSRISATPPMKLGNLIQYTADVSECLLITHCKHPFQKTSCQVGFVEQCVVVLDHEEII